MMPVPNRLDNYSCCLVILCPYIKTQNANVNKTKYGSGHYDYSGVL